MFQNICVQERSTTGSKQLGSGRVGSVRVMGQSYIQTRGPNSVCTNYIPSTCKNLFFYLQSGYEMNE